MGKMSWHFLNLLPTVKAVMVFVIFYWPILLWNLLDVDRGLFIGPWDKTIKDLLAWGSVFFFFPVLSRGLPFGGIRLSDKSFCFQCRPCFRWKQRACLYSDSQTQHCLLSELTKISSKRYFNSRTQDLMDWKCELFSGSFNTRARLFRHYQLHQ